VIRLTIAASKALVQEDPAYNAGVFQGLTGYYLDPTAVLSAAFLANPTPAAALAAGYLANTKLQVWLSNSAGQQGQAYEPITFGGSDGRVHGGEGGYVGGQGSGILLISSVSAAGGILLTEWP
jgi:hypothetical protein